MGSEKYNLRGVHEKVFNIISFIYIVLVSLLLLVMLFLVRSNDS